MTDLALYDAAKRALQACVELDEVQTMHNQAAAAEAYARQARDPTLIQYATEMRVRAERRIGEFLAAMPKATGARGVGTSAVPKADRTPTLAAIGVTKNESARWQKLAAVPQDKFEQAVAIAKETAGKVAASIILKASADAQERRAAKPERTPAARACDAPERIREVTEALARERANAAEMAARLDAWTWANAGAEVSARHITTLDARIAVLERHNDTLVTRIAALTRSVAYWKRMAKA